MDKLSSLLQALNGSTPTSVPIWFMRQAGRSLPEYRDIKGSTPILDLLKNPEIVKTITLQPVSRHNVDAAILYSDIVLPLLVAGIDLRIEAGTGPKITEPFNTPNDTEKLNGDVVNSIPAKLDFVGEAVKLIVSEANVPLIGFAGGPFTLACYLIDGESSKTWSKTKSFMRTFPEAFSLLLNNLALLCAQFIRVQLLSGASVFQVFDSWVGVLDRCDFERFVVPSINAIRSSLSDFNQPMIYFGVNTSHLLDLMTSLDVDCIGIDWRISLTSAAESMNYNHSIQGNLDPSLLLSPFDVIKPIILQTLEEGMRIGGTNTKIGYIFNLGHGVLPETNPATITKTVELVHEFGRY